MAHSVASILTNPKPITPGPPMIKTMETESCAKNYDDHMHYNLNSYRGFYREFYKGVVYGLFRGIIGVYYS